MTGPKTDGSAISADRPCTIACGPTSQPSVLQLSRSAGLPSEPNPSFPTDGALGVHAIDIPDSVNHDEQQWRFPAAGPTDGLTWEWTGLLWSTVYSDYTVHGAD